VSLALTWTRRLCLLRVLLCVSHCYKLSPFQAHWGGDTAPAFSGHCVHLQFTWEVGLVPSPVEFSSYHCFYKLSCSWFLGLCCCSCLLQPGLFIYSSMRDSPSPPFSIQASPPSLLCVLFFLVLIIQFLFFSLGGGQSVQGAMLICPRVVCGSITYRLAHLVVHVFPSHLGTGFWWQCRSPPGFSV
jgi:hypothetical protein